MTALLSVPVVAFLQGALTLLLALTAWALLMGRHDWRATTLWCVGGVIGGLASLLISVRDDLPAWIGVGGTIGLTVAGFLLRTAALYRELGRTVPWRTMAVFLIVSVAAYVAADTVTLDARTTAGLLIRAVASAWLAFVASRLHRRDCSRSAALIGVASLLLALTYGVRGSEIVWSWVADVEQDAKDYAGAIAAGVLAALFTHVGYVGLAWEQARQREQAHSRELTREHARFVELERHFRELDAARAQRQKQLQETVPAMMHSIDAQGLLVAVSDLWVDKLGYTRAEVIGRPSVQFLTPKSRDYARAVVLPGFFRDGRCDNVPYEMVRRDGSFIEVRLSAVLERDEAGRPLRSLAVIEDLSDLGARQAELLREQAQRQEAERQALELNRLLAERDEMLRVLAHEVRQPLNNASAALQGAAAILAQSGSAAAQPIRQAETVLNDILGGLNNTLAEAALLAAGELHCEDCDVDMVLAIAIADMPLPARTRIRIERSTSTRTASMDPALMRLALRNLLANALAYAAPASPVVLRVLDGEEPLSLILECRNEGPCIAPDVASRLFKRGAQGPRRASGRAAQGLGLYIVGRVMQLHRGAAALVCNRDDAVTFQLVIPQALEASLASSAHSQAIADP